MDKGSRRSSRSVRLRREPGFVYDKESVNFILSREDSRETWHQRRRQSSSDDVVLPDSNRVTLKYCKKVSTVDTSQYDTSAASSEEFNQFPFVFEQSKSGNVTAEESKGSPSQRRKKSANSSSAVQFSGVNNSADSDIAGPRLDLTTRWDFLDFTEPFLSVGPKYIS